MIEAKAALPHLDVDLSISIVTWNSQADILACVDSLRAAVGDLSFVVTVVDNASSDETVEMLEGARPEVEILRNEENLGFSAGHNRAMRQGVGRYHLILNPDTIALPGSLEVLVRFLERNAEAAFVGPKILEKDGSVYPSCRSFPTPGALLFRNKLLAGLFPRNPYTRDYLMGDRRHDRLMSAGWLSGSVLMVSRSALEAIGLLDERFFMYCEDMDWCRRAHDGGWGVYYEPEGQIVHLRARSTDRCIPAMVLEHHRSMWKYYVKHESRHHPWLWSAGVAAVISMRAMALVTDHYIRRVWRQVRDGRW